MRIYANGILVRNIFSSKAIYLMAVLCLAFMGKSWGQLSITSLPASYSNNFNSYNPTSAATIASTANSTGIGSGISNLTSAGWTGTSSGTATFNGQGTGSSATGGNWGYGSSGNFSLGALRSGTPGNITYTLSFTNNSGSTIGSLTIAWDYRQYRFSNTSGWDCSGTGGLSGNATLTGKDFTGAASGTSGATTAISSFTLSGLSIANGASFGIQWVTSDVSGSDNGVAIDNFSLSAAVAATAPTITTPTATLISATSATLGATITGNGGSAITERGTVYKTSTGVLITDNKLAEGGTTVAAFSHSRSLSSQTQYFYKGYASNIIGTTLTSEASFRTLSSPPTAQSSGLSATAFSSSQIDLTITAATFPGSGATRAGYVVIYSTGTPTLSSANGTAPAAGVGTIFATTSTALPSTPATTVNVTGLNPSTAYNFLVVPYTWDGTNAATYNYLTTSAPTANASTNANITVAISNTNLAQFTTQNLTRNTSNTPVSRFQVTVANGTATLSTLSFATPNNAITNSYVNTDISNFKLYYTTGTTFNTSTPIAGASTQASGKALTTTGETITFTGLSQTLAAGTYYLWVTADILGTATTGRTLTINAPTLTASVGSVSGSTSATGIQTIVAASPTSYFLVANNAGSASNWNTVADGSGTALASLNNPTDVNLIVDDETNASISGDITLGNNSKFIISQGSPAKLTINGCLVTATIDVGSAGTLDFFNSAAQQSATTIGILATGSTVEYSNTANQTISRTINFSNLTISGAAIKTAASGGAMQVANNLTINNGGTFALNGTNNLALTGTLTVAAGATFDNGGESQITNSGGSINISGTFITRDAEGFTGSNSAIPSITPVVNSGSTIEYGLAGNQTITDFTYDNLTFSNSGTKSTTGAVSSITGTVTIKDAAIVNVANNTFGGTGTNLTMTGTSRLIASGARQVPDMDGIYTLTGGTVEFAGNSPSHTARSGASITYNNIEITGLNVNGSSGNYNIAAGGSFTVATGAKFSVTDQEVVAVGTGVNVIINGTFHTSDADGFAGNANTSINATNITLTLGSSSTIEYGRSGNQVLTPLTDYNNVTLSGSGIKDAASAFTVNGTFTLTGTASLGTTSPTYGTGSTLAYINPTDGLAYTEALEWPSTNPPTNVTMNLSGASSPSLNIASNKTIAGTLSLTAGTFNINGNTLTLNGSFAGAGLLKGSSTSSISIGGTGSLGTLNFDQTIDGTSNALSNLAYNRTGGGTFSLGNKLVLVDVITPTAGTLTTNGFLHLRSTAVNTARIAAGSSSGGYINGNVTVERYLSASNNRAYRLLTPSVNTSTTINANWQEGQSNPDAATNMPSATTEYGTHITGTGGSTNGFDATYTNQASLYMYNAANPSWDAVTNTNVNTLNANTGYLLFIRGNRDNLNVLQSTAPSSNTTLRATGTLPQGNISFNNLSSNTAFSLVTNPYASPILWDNATGIYSAGSNATNFEDYITIWDPNIGTRGGYVTVTTANVTAGGASNLTNEIQSGQAFFVQAKAGINTPTLDLLETHKSTTNNLNVFRLGTQTETLKTFLYFTDINGNDRSADGVTSIFNNSYSNEVNGNDAVQIDNWDEDVSINRDNKLLSIESRKLADANDTIHLAIARLKTQAYKWKIVPQNFNAPNLIAQLRDNFTGTYTTISLTDTTVISFSATSDPASKAANRFSIVFKENGAVPVSIKSIQASPKNNGIEVKWDVANELNMDRYEAEKSNDAIHFTKLHTQIATGSPSYQCFDPTPINGNNFYRIKAIDKSGKETYTQVVKVTIGIAAGFISVSPNPLTGNRVSLQLNNIKSGTYSVTIINSNGQTLYSKMLVHNGTTAAYQLQLNNVPSSGTYQLSIRGNNGPLFTQKLMKL